MKWNVEILSKFTTINCTIIDTKLGNLFNFSTFSQTQFLNAFLRKNFIKIDAFIYTHGQRKTQQRAVCASTH